MVDSSAQKHSMDLQPESKLRDFIGKAFSYFHHDTSYKKKVDQYTAQSIQGLAFRLHRTPNLHLSNFRQDLARMNGTGDDRDFHSVASFLEPLCSLHSLLSKPLSDDDDDALMKDFRQVLVVFVNDIMSLPSSEFLNDQLSLRVYTIISESLTILSRSEKPDLRAVCAEIASLFLEDASVAKNGLFLPTITLLLKLYDDHEGYFTSRSRFAAKCEKIRDHSSFKPIIFANDASSTLADTAMPPTAERVKDATSSSSSSSSKSFVTKEQVIDYVSAFVDKLIDINLYLDWYEDDLKRAVKSFREADSNRDLCTKFTDFVQLVRSYTKSRLPNHEIWVTRLIEIYVIYSPLWIDVGALKDDSFDANFAYAMSEFIRISMNLGEKPVEDIGSFAYLLDCLAVNIQLDTEKDKRNLLTEIYDIIDKSPSIRKEYSDYLSTIEAALKGSL